MRPEWTFLSVCLTPLGPCGVRGPKTAALRGGAWECRDKGGAGKGGVMLPGSLPFGTLTGLAPHPSYRHHQRSPTSAPRSRRGGRLDHSVRPQRTLIWFTLSSTLAGNTARSRANFSLPTFPPPRASAAPPLSLPNASCQWEEWNLKQVA
ncbi:hypothetical protein E2C01_005905 [Portunus trituberculatus]|uniref:Uncharacterized protein n=1 Tax=Portunus trituberculatus TaxID=210409 RepID=A0A5B7D0C8_PORTR|nr:hypothetical protein [Portunus trituberculatus]